MAHMIDVHGPTVEVEEESIAANSICQTQSGPVAITNIQKDFVVANVLCQMETPEDATSGVQKERVEADSTGQMKGLSEVAGKVEKESIFAASGSLQMRDVNDASAKVKNESNDVAASKTIKMNTTNSASSEERVYQPDHNANSYIGRPHPGVWFTLQPKTKRNEEALPQKPKYIRVKDPNMTIFTIKSYLVKKLGLTNEAEVEVSCMGQTLLDSQTMEYVRTEIWLPNFIECVHASLAPTFDATQIGRELMALDYEKSNSTTVNP